MDTGHVKRQAEFRQFALDHVHPHAADHDRSGCLSERVIPELGQRGYFAPFLPLCWGGGAMDMVTYGTLHEEIGRSCSSVRSLLTVNDMAAFTIFRWGSQLQRRTWLPALSAGAVIGALAISEPNAGSDVSGIETMAELDADTFVLNGQKKWITCGEIAGIFIVLTRSQFGPTAFVIERDRPGLSIQPIRGLLGTRGSMLALLTFTNCRVPRENLIGRPGFGANLVTQSALGLGRYSVACGSLGIAQACLDCCYEYASGTRRFGVALKEHQLIQQMITDSITEVSAARLLCRRAGVMKDANDPQELMQTFIAKYYASTSAMRAADRAVQIHGANGCSDNYPVERFLRDAKVMQIIEGSSQLQQITIATLGFQDFERERLTAGIPTARMT
jgi:glutaryl-CoA dehydrogenase (non-decarboxylating)